MIKQLLHKKLVLQDTPLFDSNYFTKKHCPSNLTGSVTTEVWYLNEKSLWLNGTSGLFNGSYYVHGSDDLSELEYPPLIHYLTNGYFEARRPSALIDIDYIVCQILGYDLPDNDSEKHKVKQDVLSRYDSIYSLLKTTEVNPNKLFDNAYFIEKNKLSDLAIEIPIQFYYSNEATHPITGSPLETTAVFNMEKYLEINSDVHASGLNPLEHLLTHGLREKRLSCFTDLISQTFLDNTADLYQDRHYNEHEYFLAKSITSGQIAGPLWQSKYKENSHPALIVKNEVIKNIRVTIGTVLYNNTESELQRLKSSIEKEIDHSEEISIDDLYFVNDDNNFELYESILGNDKLVRSTTGNIGFGSAHNHLMERAFADSEYYFGVNPDGFIIRNCIQSLVNFSKHYEDSSLVEANTLPVNHPKWFDPVLFDTKWVSGVAFFLPRNIWQDIGGFDENIHMYCEDVDFSWRVKAAGYSLKTCPVASFFHDVTDRFSDSSDSEADRKRRKSMLMGAHYLATKWQAFEHADNYMKILVNENLLLPNQVLEPPEDLIPVSVAQHFSDFKHDLRFSPSRFW